MTGNTSPVQAQGRFRLGFTSRVVSSLALVAAFAFVGGQQAQAAIIVEYDNGNLGTVSQKDPLVIATPLSVSGASLVVGSNSYYRTNDWSTADTLQLNDYIQFTVTADPGYELTLTSWQFKDSKATSGPAKNRLQVSFDNFSTVAYTTDRNPGNNISNHRTFGLGSITGSVATFRMYYWDATNPATTHYLDDLAIHGTVNLVPEPASLGLLGLGLACLVGGRSQRRRRSAAA